MCVRLGQGACDPSRTNQYTHTHLHTVQWCRFCRQAAVSMSHTYARAGATGCRSECVCVCVCVCVHRRPSMEDVAALLSGRLMSALERLTASEQRLQRALTLERAHQRRAASAGFMLPAVPDTPFALPSPLPFAHTQSPHVLSSPVRAARTHTHTHTQCSVPSLCPVISARAYTHKHEPSSNCPRRVT